MDKALMLGLGGIVTVFMLIPDKKDPVPPMPAAPKAAAPKETAPVETVSAAPADPMADIVAQSTVQVNANRNVQDSDSEVDLGTPRVTRQIPGSVSPSASKEEHRAQSLAEEAAYQAQRRGH